MRKYLILFVLIFFTVIFFTRITKSGEKRLFSESTNKIQIDQANNFSFQELTIPYLRSRNYQSNLSELDKHRDYPSYKSYLTSYLSDGLKINGLLTIPDPPANGPPQDGYPAIVFVHGYIAPSIYRTTERYQDYVDYLARSGFVVFKIDLRGHGSSEGEAGGAYYSDDYVVDTLNAYSALQNADFVNPEKIALWGHSMAGNVTFRSFVVNQNIPAIAVWAGAGFTYTDLQNYRLNDNSYRPPQQNTRRSEERQRLRNDYGDFDSESWFWKLVVPTNHLDDVKGSIALFHAENDPVVSVEYSKNLDTVLLNAKNIEHELHLYQTGGHNLEGSTFSAAMQSTVAFFRKALGL